MGMSFLAADLGYYNSRSSRPIQGSPDEVVRVRSFGRTVINSPGCLTPQRSTRRIPRYPGKHALGSFQRKRTITRVVPMRPVPEDDIDQHKDVKLLDGDSSPDESEAQGR
jgi:hypothetical protein